MESDKNPNQKLLEVWERNLEALKKSQPKFNPDLQKKLTILAKFHQINTPSMVQLQLQSEPIGPIKPINDPIETEIKLNTQLSAVLDDIKQPLDDLISSKSKRLRKLQEESIDPIEKLKNLKDRTRKLTIYLKTVITEYLLVYQFPKLLNSRDNILKLIEVLLNNSVTSSISGEDIWLLLSDREDPFIRFLILNQLVLIDPQNKNRIKLNNSCINSNNKIDFISV